MNKKIFAILFVLICALSISAVSALDDTANDVAAVDVAGSFADLQSEITGETGDTITLEKNYTNAGSESAITIDKDLTIDGTGFTIDANEKSSIFTIVKGSTVTIKGITFINAVGGATNGAITNHGDLTLIDCKFINNTAGSGAGVLNYGNLTVDKCLFENNSVKLGVAAVNEDLGGSAIYSTQYSNATITNSKIINNNLGYVHGDPVMGVVCSYGDSLTIKNTTFENNSGRWGGAISYYALKVNGVRTPVKNPVVIDNCTFVGNRALYGNGIYCYVNAIELTNSTFINNYANGKGDMSPHDNTGTVCIAGTPGGDVPAEAAYIDNCTFINNTANFGAAIDIGQVKESTIANCNFTNNTAVNMTNPGAGGAIYIGGPDYGEKVNVEGCEFVNNTACGEGGAIFANSISNATVANSNFANNSAVIGGDIFANTTNLVLDNVVANVTEATEITVDPVANATSMDNVTIKGTVAPNANGQVNVTIGTTTKTFNVTDGKFEANMGNLVAGEYEAIVNFINNTNYLASTATSNKFNVTKVNSTITVAANKTIVANQNLTVTGTVENIADGAIINITVGAATQNATVKDGKFNATISGLDAGNYTVVAAFKGDASANPSSATANVTVESIETAIAVEDITIDAGDSLTVNVTTENIPDDAVITLKIGDKEYTGTVSNNTASIGVTDVPEAGAYKFNVTYAGDAKCDAASANATLVVRSVPTIEIDAINKTEVNKNVTVTGNTTGLANGTNITITTVIDGETKNYTVAVVNNTFKQDLGNITAEGTLDITVSFEGNATVAPAEDAISVTIGRDTAVITAENVTVAYNQTVAIEGTINVGNANITITVDGKTYNVTADADGNFNQVVNVTEVGNYTATIAFAGDKNMTAATATVTIVITKIATTVTVEDVTVDATENITISGTTSGIPENATVDITVGDLIVNATVKDDKFSVTIDPMAKGNYTIEVTYAGDDYYEAANATANLTVNGIDTTFEIENITIFVDENLSVIITTTGFENNTEIDIAVVIDNVASNATVTVVDNEIDISDLFEVKEGSINCSAIFEGNSIYNPCEANFTVTVKKYPTTTTIVNITESIQAGDNVKVNATVVDANGTAVKEGNASILINDKLVETQAVVNGTVKFDLANVTAGNKTVTVIYEGSDKYAASNATSKVEINGTDAVLTVPDVELYFKNGTALEIFLTANGTNVSGENVAILINNKTYYREVTNGTAQFAINLPPGTYNVTVSLDSLKYNPASVNATVTVLPTVFMNDTVLYFRNGTKLNAVFLDGQGNPLSNATASFNINGKIYEREIVNGTTSGVALNLPVGNYVVSVMMSNGAAASCNVTILSTIEGNNTEMYYKDGTRFNAEFLDAQGNPLSNGTASFNINGKIYEREIVNGTTSGVPLNLLPGTYVVTATAPNAQAVSFNVTILPTLITSDLVKYFKNETQFVMNVVDINGTAFANQTIDININGVIYHRTSDENGTAVFNINLPAGNSEPREYILTASCNGCMVSNTVTVLPILTGEDVSGPSGTFRYTINRVDGQGNPVANKTVSLNINGKIYNRETDVNGTASLAINLPAGEYIITALDSQTNATISNTVTVTA